MGAKSYDNNMIIVNMLTYLSCISENGKHNPWEETSQAQKAWPSQEDSWKKPESSGRSPWSYKALRGSALGPIVALLRAQNEL